MRSSKEIVFKESPELKKYQSYEVLPIELWVMIFHYLSLPELLKIRLANKFFYYASQSNFWRLLHISYSAKSLEIPWNLVGNATITSSVYNAVKLTELPSARNVIFIVEDPNDIQDLPQDREYDLVMKLFDNQVPKFNYEKIKLFHLIIYQYSDEIATFIKERNVVSVTMEQPAFLWNFNNWLAIIQKKPLKKLSLISSHINSMNCKKLIETIGDPGCSVNLVSLKYSGTNFFRDDTLEELRKYPKSELLYELDLRVKKNNVTNKALLDFLNILPKKYTNLRILGLSLFKLDERIIRSFITNINLIPNLKEIRIGRITIVEGTNAKLHQMQLKEQILPYILIERLLKQTQVKKIYIDYKFNTLNLLKIAYTLCKSQNIQFISLKITENANIKILKKFCHEVSKINRKIRIDFGREDFNIEFSTILNEMKIEQKQQSYYR